MKALLMVAFLALTLLTLTTSILADDDQVEYTPSEIVRNEQRKKLGMAPLPPKGPKKKRVKTPNGQGQKVTGPGAVGMAPFKAPKQTPTGYITVHKNNVNGPVLGFLDNHRVVKSAEQATKYTYTVTGPLIEIMVVDSDLRMCVITGMYGQSLGSMSKNFHLPRQYPLSTKPGDRPLHAPKSAIHFESSVFSIDPDTHQIDIQWVNPDGSLPPVQIALMDDRIYYVGDLMAFRDYTNAVVTPVVYRWASVTV